MSEEINDLYVIGTSGHRKVNDYDAMFDAIEMMGNHIKVIEVEFDVKPLVVIGGAKGWDKQVTKMCYRKDIDYELNFAFLNDDIYTYYLRDSAVRFSYLKDEYCRKEDVNLYFKRNRSIVAKSNVLYVYWDGREKGGTYYTKNYAEDKINVVNWFIMKNFLTNV